MRCLIKYKIRRLAASKVQRALIANKIEKPYICSKCGKHGKRIEGHHEDYRKVLKVVWLCTKCHGIIHRGKNTQSAKIAAIKLKSQQKQRYKEQLDELWESNKIEPDPVDYIYSNMIFEEYRHQLSLEPTILGEKII